MDKPMGYLKFYVTTASGALPITGAHIIVSSDESGNSETLQTLITNGSGESRKISLETMSSSLSQAPAKDGQNALPYKTYDARVDYPGYYSVVMKNIPIFENITSIQNVALIPLPDGITNPDPIIIEEGQARI